MKERVPAWPPCGSGAYAMRTRAGSQPPPWGWAATREAELAEDGLAEAKPKSAVARCASEAKAARLRKWSAAKARRGLCVVAAVAAASAAAKSGAQRLRPTRRYAVAAASALAAAANAAWRAAAAVAATTAAAWAAAATAATAGAAAAAAAVAAAVAATSWGPSKTSASSTSGSARLQWPELPSAVTSLNLRLVPMQGGSAIES